MSVARDFSFVPEKAGPSQKGILKIHDKIESLIHKANKDPHYSIKQNELNRFAEQLIEIINEHHRHIERWEAPLKAAIIDLTEVPTMHKELQRIAYITALKDALKNLERFLSDSTR